MPRLVRIVLMGGRTMCVHETRTERALMTRGTVTRTWFFVMAVLALVLPDNALALQVHGEPEGLYVHQMAHLHYIFALGYFYWDIRRASFTGRGWRYLQMFCILMACWNTLAFIGHLVGVYLDPQALLQTDCYLQTRLVGPLTLHQYLYFITKLDHLMYVPALFCLFLGLRSFYRSVVTASAGSGK